MLGHILFAFIFLKYHKYENVLNEYFDICISQNLALFATAFKLKLIIEVYPFLINWIICDDSVVCWDNKPPMNV